MNSKRLFDCSLAIIGLLLLSPLLLLIAVLIKLTSRGPVFFRQKRVGQFERAFYIHKFRTMVINAEASGLKITVGRDPRITPLGHLLRKSKLDELPQLIDVLYGSMSVVGPRPEVPEFIKYYPPEARAIIFQLRPGITDSASIKMIDENEILGRAVNPHQVYIEQILPEKLAYAVAYAQRHNLYLDIQLIYLTIIKIITR